ncbi:MAG TPA: hypothetical protein VHC19_14425 [Pirellulales bacterium]|jgi:hypothetical protein|nr:hypothetical protein [Pirellulales bacterium]
MVQSISGSSYVSQVVAQASQQNSTSAAATEASSQPKDTLTLSSAALKASGGDPDGDNDGH